MRAYFIPSVPTFIPESWKNDGTYTEENWPTDAVLLTKTVTEKYWMVEPPEGKMLGVVKGLPAWVEIPPPTQDELIATAERKLSFLLREAEKVTSDWKTELSLGIIDDEERNKLIKWMKYIKSLKSIDTSITEEIDWPEKPSI